MTTTLSPARTLLLLLILSAGSPLLLTEAVVAASPQLTVIVPRGCQRGADHELTFDTEMGVASPAMMILVVLTAICVLRSPKTASTFRGSRTISHVADRILSTGLNSNRSSRHSNCPFRAWLSILNTARRCMSLAADASARSSMQLAPTSVANS